MAIRNGDEPEKFGYQRDGSYLPSPAEIKRKCEAIRRGWPPREFYQRAKWAFTDPVIAVKDAAYGDMAAALAP